MYTVPKYQNQGIATTLLSSIINEAKDNGCQRILLDTSDMGKQKYEKPLKKEVEYSCSYSHERIFSFSER